MQEKEKIDLNTISANEIDLHELIKVLFYSKLLISFITSLALIFAVIYSLSLPNIYQSKALLTPNDLDNTSNSLKSYSGLASIAGISLPSQMGQNNAAVALKKLNSYSFFKENILPNINLTDLMAVKSWNPVNNSIILDKDIYDDNSNKWVRDFNYPQTLVPSAQESFKKFKKDHLRISEDSDTSFVTITIEHQSPYIAKAWNELMVYEINKFYREKDKTEAEKATDYLNEKIANTNFAEIKEVIAVLLQQETQKLTLIEAKESYIYEYIDPPSVMEEKFQPNRALICLVFTFMGVILGVLISLIRHYWFLKREKQ